MITSQIPETPNAPKYSHLNLGDPSVNREATYPTTPGRSIIAINMGQLGRTKSLTVFTTIRLEYPPDRSKLPNFLIPLPLSELDIPAD
jgi:hypothetical protein